MKTAEKDEKLFYLNGVDTIIVMKVLQFGYSEQNSLLQQLCGSFGCPTIRCHALDKSKCSLHSSDNITQELYKGLNNYNTTLLVNIPLFLSL